MTIPRFSDSQYRATLGDVVLSTQREVIGRTAVAPMAIIIDVSGYGALRAQRRAPALQVTNETDWALALMQIGIQAAQDGLEARLAIAISGRQKHDLDAHAGTGEEVLSIAACSLDRRRALVSATIKRGRNGRICSVGDTLVHYSFDDDVKQIFSPALNRFWQGYALTRGLSRTRSLEPPSETIRMFQQTFGVTKGSLDC